MSLFVFIAHSKFFAFLVKFIPKNFILFDAFVPFKSYVQRYVYTHKYVANVVFSLSFFVEYANSFFFFLLCKNLCRQIFTFTGPEILVMVTKSFPSPTMLKKFTHVSFQYCIVLFEKFRSPIHLDLFIYVE